MKKHLFLLVVIIGFFGVVDANPVPQEVAMRIAKNFAQANFSNVSKIAAAKLVKVTDAYFVYNFDDKCFVIVSADDSFRPIVGYSNEGVFPTENPSPEMMYYLDNLSLGRKAALRGGLQQDENIGEEWRELLNSDVDSSRGGTRESFYLVKTRWNQDFPYNKFCPANGGRTYAGCVATAMSQVMNYWQYPTHGSGQHSYTYGQYGELSANFAEATYDFDLMPNSISEQSPVENIDAIAMFMYHCGIAVDMMYGTDGSGAYSEDVPEAVLKYFGYTNCCRLVYRDNLSLGEFQAQLKAQFDLGWPVYYSGSDTNGGGGHAFVCDGYDEDDLFHFNWGWSGSGDGFYAIDELNVSSYAFNSGQAFIANFVPAEVFANTLKAPDLFTAVPNGDEKFSVTLSWVNPSATLQGVPVETIDRIVVLRDRREVQRFENPTPGETMTYVDEAGQPVTVSYSVYAVCQGHNGRMAQLRGISLGPTCLWTVNLTSDSEEGMGGGWLSIINSGGVTVAELSADRGATSTQVEVPQGRITLRWTAPADTLELGVEVLDADGNKVFDYQGPSHLMPKGIFFETVNTCGGVGSISNPTNLKATVNADDVLLAWTGVADPGYGYNIYRDGRLYAMSPAPSFTDEGAAQGDHSYFVTAFCKEGETDPSNTVCAALETDDQAPTAFDGEVMENGRVKLTWEKPLNSENLVGYAIYRKTMGQEYKCLKLFGDNAVTYTDPFNVADGEHYCYKLVAVHRPDNVESAPAQSLRHPEQYFVEVNRTHIPYGLTIDVQEDHLVLQWEEAMLAETYNVYRNGELIANDVAENQYSLAADGVPAYYQVTGVLHGVESNRSNKAFYANYAVEENDGPQVSLFPNPAHGVITVKAERLIDVTVYNLTGQQVECRHANGDELEVDLTGMKAGVYYLQINTENCHQVKKVVLMK